MPSGLFALDAGPTIDAAIARMEAIARSPSLVERFLASVSPETFGTEESRRERDALGEEVPRDMGRSEAIRYAMEHGLQLRLTYTRKYDETTADYQCDAYEVKPHDTSGVTMLYATERNKHGPAIIHSFLYSRIDDVQPIPNTSYVPRWPVQPESVG